MPANRAAGTPRRAPLLAVLRRTFLPNVVLAVVAEGTAVAALAKVAPFVAEKVAQSRPRDRLRVRARACELPTTDPAEFARQLAKPPRPY